MLKQSVYDVMLTEVENLDAKVTYKQSEAFAPVAEFRIKRQVAVRLSALVLLQKNIEFLRAQRLSYESPERVYEKPDPPYNSA